MKLKISWAILIIAIIYGLLPVTIPDKTNNFNKPNVLLIDRQECGCPCAEGIIRRGKLQISQEIKNKFPELDDNQIEITLVDFPPYDDISNDNPQTFDFANYNSFKVTGQVIGVDTILCDPQNCEVVPKFRVTNWALTSYYPRFYNLSIVTTLFYFGMLVTGIPILTFLTVDKWRQLRKQKRQ